MKYPRILLFLLFSLGLARPILAHGARIDYQQTSAIAIRATYDDGTPMAGAQAIVYAPDDPTTPWLKGITDESGRFIFAPDPNLVGNWDVKVRQSGHGDIVSIPLSKSDVISTTKSEKNGLTVDFSQQAPKSQSSYSLGQKLLMAIAISWGCLGTALFFARKPSHFGVKNS